MRKDVYYKLERIRNMGIKISATKLAREMNCDPRTVRKYLKMEQLKTENKKKKKSKLDKFKNLIDEKLEDGMSYSFISIYEYIKLKGYNGKYGIVRAYTKNFKENKIRKATVRFETNPGLQAQVDYKEKKKMITKSGKVITFDIFLYVLGYSRIKYFQIVENKKQTTLFKAMINAFIKTGGVPAEILFDNMKTVVDRNDFRNGEVKVNKKFQQLADDMGFKVLACRPYRPQTKGKVEALAKLMNRLDVFNNEFETIDELKVIVEQVNESLNNSKSQAINEKPIDRLKKEQEYLQPLPNSNITDSYINTFIDKKVSKESMINIRGNKYSVPTKYIGRIVQIKNQSNTIEIFYDNKLICAHESSETRFNYRYEDIKEILKSDAFKYSSDEELEQIIEVNMNNLDTIVTYQEGHI